MKRYFLIASVSLLLAVTAVLANTPGSWEQYRFNTDRFDTDTETAEVIKTLKLFSATMAGFYMTSGNSAEGLNVFPAVNPIKRRIYMDINMYALSQVVFVPDRDVTEYREIIFLSPRHAMAITNETWFNTYLHSVTRKRLSDKKATLLTVRYYLHKQGGKWIVLDYEVHDQGEKLPPVPADKVLQW